MTSAEPTILLEVQRGAQRLAIWWSAACLLAFSLGVHPVEANILTFAGTTKKSPPFPKGTTLDVCIQADPDGHGRAQLLKEGIERWKKPLADRMIELKVTVLAPGATLPKAGGTPGGADNKIVYRWVNSGQLGEMEVGPGKNNGAAAPNVSKNGKKLVGGEAIIHRGLPDPDDDPVKKNLIKNVGEHEFAHILGLAHDGAGAVTKHEQSGAPRDLNGEDTKELNSLYGTAKTGGAGKPKGNAVKTGGGGGMGFFQYRVDFEPANAVADPDDPEHVAFMAFGIDPSLVSGLTLPPGWVGLVPTGPVLITDPFFTADEYMVDGAPNPTPWAPGPAPTFIALRQSLEEAASDGLPPGLSPALSLDQPSFDLRILTDALAEGPIQVWAGGELQTVTGPVPEPAAFLLFGSGLLGLAGWRRQEIRTGCGKRRR